jgi:hypothetical protein
MRSWRGRPEWWMAWTMAACLTTASLAFTGSTWWPLVTVPPCHFGTVSPFQTVHWALAGRCRPVLCGPPVCPRWSLALLMTSTIPSPSPALHPSHVQPLACLHPASRSPIVQSCEHDRDPPFPHIAGAAPTELAAVAPWRRPPPPQSLSPPLTCSTCPTNPTGSA